MKKTILIVVAAIILIGFASLFVKKQVSAPEIVVKDYESCVQAGNPTQETYPPRCRTSDGVMFIQNIGNELEKSNRIVIENPRPNQEIKSPIEIRGKARGPWYFEASFPAKLLDGNGKQIAQIPVQAEGEWMTTDFVPFRATMKFPAPTTATGTLILERDNPSGLPENADQLVVPIKFAK